MLVEHHVKYKEIHGVDETKLMTVSEHRKLHIRLRKTGKCKIPVDELTKISRRASARTDSRKAYQKQPHIRKANRNYLKKNMECLRFSESFGEHTRFEERIDYNKITGTVTYSSGFRGNPSCIKLRFINEVKR